MHRVALSVLGGEVQGRIMLPVNHVHVRFEVVHEQLDHLDVALGRRQMERGAPKSVGVARRRAGPEQRTAYFEVAVLRVEGVSGV